MFKKLICLFAVLNFVCCEYDQKPISYVEFLKESGYKTLSCNLSYDSINRTFDLTAFVEPKSINTEMILARCVENNCSFETIQDTAIPAQIICQKFYNEENEFTSEYDVEQVILTYNTKRFADIKE